MNKKIRHCGVLLHPTSLPAKHGIGDLGATALAFIDFLAEARVGIWQILPLGPVGFGNSPYASRSAFAGNELLIDLDELAAEGYVDLAEVFTYPRFPAERVDFQQVANYKLPLLKAAAKNFLSAEQTQAHVEYRRFCEKQAAWLDDYALYAALCDHYGDTRWHQVWDKGLARRTKTALATWTRSLANEVESYRVLQFFFERQWQAVRHHANERGVAIVGDIPIFVAHDSVDAWCNRKYLKMDAQGNSTALSGVPPDAFSATGQLWGNPVYDWEALERDGFSWWVRRMERAFALTDMVRIDHFRGFEAYWEVPAKELTAEHGSWVPAPGEKLFAVLREKFGTLPVFAEDLGVITDAVEQLRDSNGFPGMKVAQFGFNVDKHGRFDADNVYLPHNYAYDVVAYSGTHDNDTTKGWYASLDGVTKDAVRRYLACPDEAVVWHLVRAVLASHARYAIIPMQDFLQSGSESRMNTPGTCGDHNWSWRVKHSDVNSAVAASIADLVSLFGRSSNR